jgi:uncharacterized damage-inducible protein DinB
MISTEHVRTMARYNEWQNRSLYGAADTIPDAERRRERGAFFGSIHGTLSHLLWADYLWLGRFAGAGERRFGTIKESPGLFPDWQDLKSRRKAQDEAIRTWADNLDASALYGNLTWVSGIAGKERSLPRWLTITHFFNHQTHHRGQVHAMLTAAGAKPDDTDLILMPG